MALACCTVPNPRQHLTDRRLSERMSHFGLSPLAARGRGRGGGMIWAAASGCPWRPGWAAGCTQISASPVAKQAGHTPFHSGFTGL